MNSSKMFGLGSPQDTLTVKKSLNGNETLTNKKTDSSTNKRSVKTTNNEGATQSSNNGSRNFSGNYVHIGTKYELHVDHHHHHHHHHHHNYHHKENTGDEQQSKKRLPHSQDQKGSPNRVLDVRNVVATGVAVGTLVSLVLTSTQRSQHRKNTSDELIQAKIAKMTASPTIRGPRMNNQREA